MSDALVIIEQKQIIPNILYFHRVTCDWLETIKFNVWEYVCYSFLLKTSIYIFMSYPYYKERLWLQYKTKDLL